jgi:hypothetical protein
MSADERGDAGTSRGERGVDGSQPRPRTPFAAGSLRKGQSKVLVTRDFPTEPPVGPWSLEAVIRISGDEEPGGEVDSETPESDGRPPG